MDVERKAALLEQISEKHNGRADREASQSLQDKLRLIDREFEEISGTANGPSTEGREGTDEPTGNEGTGGGDDSGYAFSDGQTDESDSSAYQDTSGIERDAEAARPVDGAKKPGGLAIVPSKREKKIRDDEAKRRANAAKQARFRQRKKAAAAAQSTDDDEVSPTTARPTAKRSLLDALPIGKGKAEKVVRKAFTETEARVLKPMLVSAMLDYFSYADELLYATIKGHPRVEIWSTIDDEECGILADALIARGKRSAAGAAQVQAMIDVHKNLKVGMILAPRFYQTFRVYVDNGIGISDKAPKRG